LKLKKYFPSCPFGNILITTRNRELRHYTAKDADADIQGMDLEDAKKLLLVQARVQSNVGNNALTETIVQVNPFSFSLFRRVFINCMRYRNFTALRWLSHKLALLFTATRL